MTRLACVVAAGYPHHVTQRGVRSLPIFCDDEDRKRHLEYTAQETKRRGVEDKYQNLGVYALEYGISMAEIARKLGGCIWAAAKVVLKKDGRIKGVNFPPPPPIQWKWSMGRGRVRPLRRGLWWPEHR